ncbi:MAG: GNAT family N-acetyltransferase [Actinomycetota bacterium]
MPEPDVIDTARLKLEPTTPEHATGLWDAVEASLPELRRYMSWAQDASAEHVEAFTREAKLRWVEGTGWDFVLVHDGVPAGTIGLNRYDELWRAANLGYWIRTDLAGQGLVTEAARAVVAFGFDVVELNRIELVTDLDNHPSRRIAEKLGMQREGIKRGGSFVAGESVDVYLYGLLASDPR